MKNLVALVLVLFTLSCSKESNNNAGMDGFVGAYSAVIDIPGVSIYPGSLVIYSEWGKYYLKFSNPPSSWGGASYSNGYEIKSGGSGFTAELEVLGVLYKGEGKLYNSNSVGIRVSGPNGENMRITGSR
jgi:hypothetical protein